MADLADKLIKELTEMGFTPDDMIRIFRLARQKYDAYKRTDAINCVSNK